MDEDGIIAAYAAGTTIEEIEDTYGVSREQVEALVRGDAPELENNLKPPPRAPAPVMAAVLVVALVGVTRIFTGIAESVAGVAVAVTLLSVPFYGAAAYGLWRGSRAVQWFVVLVSGIYVVAGTVGGLGVLAAAVGVTLIALLVVPMSSRAWFIHR